VTGDAGIGRCEGWRRLRGDGLGRVVELENGYTGSRDSGGTKYIY
jgi:hypothetical protein